MALVNNPGRFAHRGGVVPRASDVSSRLTGREENTLKKSGPISRLLEEASDWMDIDEDSITVESVASKPVNDGLASRIDVNGMMEEMVNQLKNK